MAKERRSFTDEDKAKILAHATEHGVTVTAGHFNIVRSVIDRWRKAAGLVKEQKTKRTRKWTPEKIAKVVEYAKSHSIEKTREHFGISGSQISLWKRGLSQSHYVKKRSKSNGAATNGLGVLDMAEKDALKWLETWRQAYFDRLKAETPSAASVLAALRGGK